MVTIIGYKRFSSKKQEQGSSEQRQDDSFSAYVERIGGQAGDVYFDPGKSAYHGYHRTGEFGRLLADCAARKFPAGSIIWFENMDRFGRGKTWVVLGDWQTIISAGYTIHVNSLGKSFDANSSELDLLTVIVQAILAHEQSKKQSERIKKAREEFRKTGRCKNGKLPKTCPSWISINEKGEYVRNAYAVKIANAVEMAINGKGSRLICEKTGCTSGIASILRSRTLLGEFQNFVHHGKGRANREAVGQPVKNYYPAIITSEDTWNRLQLALDARKKPDGKRGSSSRNPPANLFTHILVNENNVPMVLRQQRGGSDVKVLRPAITTGKGKSVLASVAENAILRFIHELKPSDVSPADDLAQQEVERLTGLLASIKTETGEYLAMLGTPGKGGLVRMGLERLQEQEKNIMIDLDKAKRSIVSNQGDNLTLAKTVIGALAGLTGEKLETARVKVKHLLRSLVQKIIVHVDDPRHAKFYVILHSGEKRLICLGKDYLAYRTSERPDEMHCYDIMAV